MATISNGTGSVAPAIIEGWDATRGSRNVIHRVIDRSAPDVTLRPAAPANGTLSLFFETYDEGVQAVALHAGAAVMTLAPTGDDPAFGMVYVVDEGQGVNLSPAVNTAHESTPWVVRVPYQAIQ